MMRSYWQVHTKINDHRIAKRRTLQNFMTSFDAIASQRDTTMLGLMYDLNYICLF